jgi:hypothetical protein
MVNGNVVAIFISPTAGGKMEEVQSAGAIAGAGLAGDRYSTARVVSTENGRGGGK